MSVEHCLHYYILGFLIEMVAKIFTNVTYVFKRQHFNLMLLFLQIGGGIREIDVYFTCI